MFDSFFPRPKLLFASLLLYVALIVAFWMTIGDSVATAIGFNLPVDDAEKVIGLGFFVTQDFLWFYLVYFVATILFWQFWSRFSPHPWQNWSILGTALIIFVTYYSVQVSVAINYWYRPFYDMLQAALDGDSSFTERDFYMRVLDFLNIALVYVIVATGTSFFLSHYVFRWRTAMNDHYTGIWDRVRRIEGASQRIQEDTMRFADIMESLGIRIVDSIMTLFAFLPILLELSVHVETLPLIGAVPAPLVTAAVLWAVFGTGILALAGIKLPGLYFRNQRVEAAFRKELVLGEDNDGRADPVSLRELFANVRRNYFRLYFHYVYFNIVRNVYLQFNNIFSLILLVPTIVAGVISFGILNRITSAFGQVASSFQFLVYSWSTIVELMSIYKRLAAFEAAIKEQPLPDLDQEFIETGGRVDDA